ncbi:hypothetical protein R1sor_008355 [Riccia sorocarpa]|uniref:HMG box domain-containing protein n=1 Tax=Riccia sorocarpa TaxID=122646 RepID=A0ABD3HVD9_9MARC
MPPRAKTNLGVKTPGTSALAESTALHDEKENILSAPLSAAAEELEKVMRRIESISVEKDRALQAVLDRETELQKKVDERQRLQYLLSANEQEQRELLERVRKLEKARDSEHFRPTILLMNMPSDSPPATARKDINKKIAAKHEFNVNEPKSPFLLWCKEHRKEVKQEYPEASFTKVSRLLREKWKNLPQVDKVPFIVQYLIAKDTHRKGASKEKNEAVPVKVFKGGKDKNLQGLLRQYLDHDLNNEEERGIKKLEKENDIEKPRKPTSGYFVYMNERKVQLRGEKMKVNEIRNLIREEWKVLDEEQKKPYQTVAAQDKARYAAEMKTYKSKKAAELKKADIQENLMQKKAVRVKKAKIQGLEAVVVEDANNQNEQRPGLVTEGDDQYKNLEKAVKELEDQDKDHSKVLKGRGRKSLSPKEQVDHLKMTPTDVKLKKKKSKSPVDPNMPTKPLPPYLLFAKENRPALKEDSVVASFAEINAMLAIKWQDMSNEEKQVWEDKAAEARDKYDKEMEEYKGKKQESVPAATS